MGKLKKIVVATDFSEGAARAARRGVLLAEERGLPVELLHVVNASGYQSIRAWFSDRSDIAERAITDAQRSLDDAVAELASPGRSVTGRLAVGDVTKELAAQSGPEVLLVLGARGETTLENLLLGSTAERTVRDARGPILIVRSEAGGPYRSVVAGVDLEQDCAMLLEDAAEFTPGASLVAFNAYRVPFEGTLHRVGVSMEEIERQRGAALQSALDKINGLRQRAALESQRLLAIAERGDPARLLVSHGVRIKADLIAVARRSRSAIESLLIGSVANHVIAEADRDVLVLRGPPLP